MLHDLEHPPQTGGLSTRAVPDFEFLDVVAAHSRALLAAPMVKRERTCAFALSECLFNERWERFPVHHHGTP